MAQLNFNAAAVEPMAPRTYGPLPNGDYEMMITRSDIKPTKAGTGHYLELEMQIISGDHSGRRHWERLNIDNPNKTAEDIAKGALAALCGAVGVTNMDDTEQLHDIPFIVSLEISKKEPDRNVITAYAPAGGAAQAPAARPAPARAAAPAPAPAAPAANKRPWA